MSSQPFSACRAYIEAQSPRSPTHGKRQELPVITISRETGAGAVTIARLVAERLNGRRKKNAVDSPWTVFDKNLVERVLEDHELPARIKQFLPENTTFDLKDAVEEMLGLHPSNWTLVEHTTDTILRLAHAGNVILIGRGSSTITAKFPTAFHVRLVAPRDARVEHVADFYKMDGAQAAKFVRTTDRARRRYVKRYFNSVVEDPLDYHLTLNTKRTGFETAARIIAEAVG